MLFTPDTELTLRAAAVLVNSNRIDGEQLADQAALDEYLDTYGWTGRRDRDAAELAEVHRLRERLGRIWAVADDEESTVEEVNAVARKVLSGRFGAAVLGPHRSKGSLPQRLRAMAG